MIFNKNTDNCSKNNKKTSEGLCLRCAKELGLPIDQMMGGALGKMGMSADQLADMEDEVNQMIANGELPDDSNVSEIEGGAPAIDFQKLMQESGLFRQGESNVPAERPQNNEKRAGDKDKKTEKKEIRKYK